jgi:hypothetical protein
MKSLYLIKRQPRPDYHKAPYHPVVICDRKKMAKYVAGNTADKATVWEREEWGNNGMGWLITRWQGLDIDYMPVVFGTLLPDGTSTGFWRDYESEFSVKHLIDSATWWSDKMMPDWLEKRGVKYPADDFSQHRILDDLADDGMSGFGNRQRPAWWPRETAKA